MFLADQGGPCGYRDREIHKFQVFFFYKFFFLLIFHTATYNYLQYILL